MKKDYQHATIEMINLDKQDVMLASMPTVGSGESTLTDDFDELFN